MPKDTSKNNSISVFKQKLLTIKYNRIQTLNRDNIHLLINTWNAQKSYETTEIKSKNPNADCFYDTQEHIKHYMRLKDKVTKSGLDSIYFQYGPEYQQRLLVDYTLETAKATLGKNLAENGTSKRYYSYESIMKNREETPRKIQDTWKSALELKKAITELEEASLKEILPTEQIEALTELVKQTQQKLQQQKDNLDPKSLHTYKKHLDRYIKETIQSETKTQGSSIVGSLLRRTSFRKKSSYMTETQENATRGSIFKRIPSIRHNKSETKDKAINAVYTTYKLAAEANDAGVKEYLTTQYTDAYYKLSDAQKIKFNKLVKSSLLSTETDHTSVSEQTQVILKPLETTTTLHAICSLFNKLYYATDAEKDTETCTALKTQYNTLFNQLTETEQQDFHNWTEDFKAKIEEKIRTEASTDWEPSLNNTAHSSNISNDTTQVDPYNTWNDNPPSDSYANTSIPAVTSNSLEPANTSQTICSLYQEMYEGDAKTKQALKKRYVTLYDQLTEVDRIAFCLWTEDFLAIKEEEIKTDVSHSSEPSLNADDVFNIYNDLRNDLTNEELTSRYSSALGSLSKHEKTRFDTMVSPDYTRNRPWAAQPSFTASPEAQINQDDLPPPPAELLSPSTSTTVPMQQSNQRSELMRQIQQGITLRKTTNNITNRQGNKTTQNNGHPVELLNKAFSTITPAKRLSSSSNSSNEHLSDDEEWNDEQPVSASSISRDATPRVVVSTNNSVIEQQQPAIPPKKAHLRRGKTEPVISGSNGNAQQSPAPGTSRAIPFQQQPLAPTNSNRKYNMFQPRAEEAPDSLLATNSGTPTLETLV